MYLLQWANWSINCVRYTMIHFSSCCAVSIVSSRPTFDRLKNICCSHDVLLSTSNPSVFSLAHFCFVYSVSKLQIHFFQRLIIMMVHFRTWWPRYTEPCKPVWKLTKLSTYFGKFQQYCVSSLVCFNVVNSSWAETRHDFLKLWSV